MYKLIYLIGTMIFFFFEKKNNKISYLHCLFDIQFQKTSIPSQDIQILPYNNKLNLIKLYIKMKTILVGRERRKLSFNLNTTKMTTQ